MKRLLWLIVLTAGLVAMVTGCGGTPRYDGRLAAVDSLMHDDPDSALALVEAIDAGSLTTAGDRAYRDLLLTQARYRCYIAATSDSAINRALAYYRAHAGEREKLTRCYLYKGAVMEELGHVDSAMTYYKTAEATASPDDYFNLGYANLRMGALYRDHYAMDGKDIEKYEIALDHLKHTDDQHYQLACMINLGSLYRLKMPQKSESMLLSARDYARQIGDTSSYSKALQALVQTYYTQEKYLPAQQMIREVLAMRRGTNNFEFCAISADVYSRLGMPDSAELLLNSTNNRDLSDVIDRMMYLESLGEIALARGDSSTFNQMDDETKRLDDSLLLLNASSVIMKAESAHDRLIAQHKREHQRRHNTWLLTVIILSVIALSLLSYQYYTKKHRYSVLINELRNTADTHICELDSLRATINELNIRDKKLKDYLDSHMWLMRNVIEGCYRAPSHKLAHKFNEILQNQEENKEKWEKLYDYIDMRYNNILSDTVKRHPDLKDKDILLLALSTLNFSCIQIVMIMGYSNPSSVGIIKQRLAKKIGWDGTLAQYIATYVSK